MRDHPLSRVLLATFLLMTCAPLAAAPGDDLLAEGQNAYSAGNYALAVTKLESFVQQYSTSSDRNKGELYLGCAYLARNEQTSDTATARTHFNYILTQGSSVKEYRDAFFHNARSYFNEEDYSTARTQLTQFLSQYPTDNFNQYVYYYLGVCESKVGTFDQARAYYARCEKEYPNSPLVGYCRLESAIIQGRKGDYQAADQALSKIVDDSNSTPELVGEATIQRALFLLVQNRPQDAISLLEAYVQKYRNDASLVVTLQDALLYEAYAYFALRDFQRALNIVDEIERLDSTLPPESATLKLKLFLCMKNVDAAESLLASIAASPYGQENADEMTSYRAMVNVAKKDYNSAIQSLFQMLQPVAVSASSTELEFRYYEQNRTNPLTALGFVESAGLLAIAYAARYGANKTEADNVAQEALYQALVKYTQNLNDPAISMALKGIDGARKKVATNPSVTQEAPLVVFTPNGFVDTRPAGGDGFVPSTGSSGSNFVSYVPSNSQGTTSPVQPGQGRPNQPNTGWQNQNQTNQGTQNQGQNQTTQGAQNQNQNQPNQGTQTSNQTPTVPSAEGESSALTPLTAAEARDYLQRATDYYTNLDFTRANELLLEAMTRSETFWQDCPAEATRIALLRAISLLELGKRSEAQMTCEDILSYAPTTQEAAVAAYYLGMLADSIGRRDDAVKYLSLATRGRNDFPYADVALYYLGTNEYERGNIDVAAQNFARVYRDYPQSPYWSHCVWRLAKIQADRRNDVAAETLVNEALQRGADSSIVDYLLFLKGEIALRAADYEKAEIAFDMLVDQYPSSVWYSRARNRLAAIPALPSPGASSASSTPKKTSSATKNAAPVKESLPPKTTPAEPTQSAQSSGNAPSRMSQEAGAPNSSRPLPPSGAESRPLSPNSAETSVKLPSAADLRERAQNSIPQELQQSRSTRKP